MLTIFWGQNQRKDVAELLIKKGANVNLFYGDAISVQCIHDMALAGHADMIELLVLHGADIGAHDEFHQTPLHSAAVAGHLETVKLILRLGAPANALSEWSRTPLHLACSVRPSVQGEIIKELIKGGANPHTVDEKGKTCLHDAAEKGNAEIIKILVFEAGVDVSLCDASSQTPLDLALKSLDQESVEILVGCGAVVSKEENLNPKEKHLLLMATVKLLILGEGSLFDWVSVSMLELLFSLLKPDPIPFHP